MSTAPRLLVVCAEPSRRSSLVAVLQQSGHAVAEASTAEETLAVCARETPKLVVLDLDPVAVPHLSRTLKARHPQIFVLQIAAIEDRPPDDATAEDVDAFLAAPVDPRALNALIRSLLRLQQVESDLRESEERLELAQDSAGLAIFDWGITTNRFVHSDLFEDLFDLPKRQAHEPFSPAILIERIHPEDLGSLLTQFAGESQTARSFDQEFRIILRDGRTRWIASRGRFFVGPSGVPERMLSLSSDITQRRESERINAQLASIVASSIDAIVSVDLDNAVTTWNAGAERLFGVSQAEMIGQPLDSVLVRDRKTPGAPAIGVATNGESSVFETTQKTRAGDPIDIAVNSAPMLGPNGAVIGASLIMRDIAPQKRREDHVRFLMRELTHRSKNLLAVIQAMARQSLSKEITPEEFVKRFSNRLSGLAGSHDLLSSLDWQGASLMDLVRSQLRHYEDLFESRIFLRGNDIIIRPEAAQNIGIALHELSTNAAKYGALSTSEGRVTIAWHVDEQGPGPFRLMMTWREEGGPSVVAPTRKGFGHIVMDRIAGQALNGKSGTQFLTEGVLWTLDVPASSVIYA